MVRIFLCSVLSGKLVNHGGQSTLRTPCHYWPGHNEAICMCSRWRRRGARGVIIKGKDAHASDCSQFGGLCKEGKGW